MRPMKFVPSLRQVVQEQEAHLELEKVRAVGHQVHHQAHQQVNRTGELMMKIVEGTKNNEDVRKNLEDEKKRTVDEKRRTDGAKKTTEGESWKLSEEMKKICEGLKKLEDKTKKDFECRTKQMLFDETEDQLAQFQVPVVLHRVKTIEQAFSEMSR
jgi:hypothetical protein